RVWMLRKKQKPLGSRVQRFLSVPCDAARRSAQSSSLGAVAPPEAEQTHAPERGREQQKRGRQRNFGYFEAIDIGIATNASAADVAGDLEEVVAGSQVQVAECQRRARRIREVAERGQRIGRAEQVEREIEAAHRLEEDGRQIRQRTDE